ncbi:MAG: hypothetical protein ACLQAT_30315 [Candidatus Binataceae bacterium]
MTRSIRWALLVLISFSTTAMAADQTVVGAGNDRAIAIAEKSPLIKSAMAFLRQEAERIHDSKLRRETLDAFTNPGTCVAHRANLSDKDKAAIIQRLIDAALVNPADAVGFPGGLTAGIFPPLKDDGTACPHLPQRFDSAPGSVFAGHHSYPGGLAVHEAFNDISDLSLAADYRMAYGHVDRAGLPSIDIAGQADFTQPDGGLDIDQDLIIAAPIWHDWAKTFVFQWNADGTEFKELNFGGNGKTDGYDGKGDSRTPGHHMLGLAESIKRGLPPEFVITQASAHSAPTLGNEFKVVNWIRAAAIIARVDPVANGYLATDASGKLRLPALAATGSFDFATVAPSAPYFLPEDTLHNLSDGNYFLAVPAAYQMGLVLAKLAPEFGFNPADAASFNNQFRNPVFSYLSAERLLFIYTRHGVDGVRSEIKRLRQLGVI